MMVNGWKDGTDSKKQYRHRQPHQDSKIRKNIQKFCNKTDGRARLNRNPSEPPTKHLKNKNDQV